MNPNNTKVADSYTIFGIGNPILDVVFKGSKKLLKKFNLVENTAVIAGPENKKLFEFMSMPKRPDMFYTPGGTVLNVLRGAQLFLERKSTVFVGCVGDDKASQFLRVAAERDGVKVEFQIDKRVCTAKSAVIITKDNRTLCAEMSAAELYSVKHLRSCNIWEYVEMCKIIYTDAFFLNSSAESVEALVEHVKTHDKILAFNLSAAFLMNTIFKSIMTVIPYTSIVFGNADEARAFAAASGWNTTDIPEIASTIAKIPRPGVEDFHGRIVAVTDGARPASIYNPKTDTVLEATVVKIRGSRIIDTTGAGDAFAGGFLAQYSKSKDIETCIWAGNYLAAIIIQNVGAVYGLNLPDTCPRQFIN